MSSVASLLMRKTIMRAALQGRSIFTSSGIGMDQFLRIKEMTVVRLGSAQASIRSRVLEDIKRDDKQIFTEDLKNLLYIAETDEEISALVNGLKKYYKNGVGYSNFHFGAPLMRALTYHNKTEKAIEIFSEKITEAAFKDSASSLVLMNHLIEKRRFSDAVKIFEIAMNRGFITANGKLIPSDVLMLLVESLYCQETPDAFAKLEKILKQAYQANCNLTIRTIGLACLFAIKQNRPDVALEMSAYGRNQHSPLFRNIKAICYADLGRPEEAMQTVRLITEAGNIDGVSPRYDRHIYPLVMQHIRTAVEKNDSDSTLKQKLEDLVRMIYDKRLMTNNDLDQFLLSPLNRTYNPNQTQDRSMDMRGNQGNYQFNDRQTGNQYYGQGYQQQQTYPNQPNSGYGTQYSPNNNFNQQSTYSGGPPFVRPNANIFPQRQTFSQQQPMNSYGSQQPPSVFGQGQQPPNTNIFQGRPPLRSPLSGASPSVIRKFSNPTSNRPGPDDENN